MGFYNVVKPCVVGNLHYARPTPIFAPIEVDDEVASPLVESGDLKRYGVFSAEELEGSIIGDVLADADGPVYLAPKFGSDSAVPIVEVQVEKPAPGPRGRRKATED